jgi:hypothetical protein
MRALCRSSAIPCTELTSSTSYYLSPGLCPPAFSARAARPAAPEISATTPGYVLRAGCACFWRAGFTFAREFTWRTFSTVLNAPCRDFLQFREWPASLQPAWVNHAPDQQFAARPTVRLSEVKFPPVGNLPCVETLQRALTAPLLRSDHRQLPDELVQESFHAPEHV